MARNAAPEWQVREFSWEAPTLAMGPKWGSSLIVCITKLNNVDTNKDIQVSAPSVALHFVECTFQPDSSAAPAPDRSAFLVAEDQGVRTFYDFAGEDEVGFSLLDF
jgi:hypothetical protein